MVQVPKHIQYTYSLKKKKKNANNWVPDRCIVASIKYIMSSKFEQRMSTKKIALDTYYVYFLEFCFQYDLAFTQFLTR